MVTEQRTAAQTGDVCSVAWLYAGTTPACADVAVELGLKAPLSAVSSEPPTRSDKLTKMAQSTNADIP